jgi:hypothetical protein
VGHLNHDDAVLVITGDAPAAALTFGHGPAPFRGSDAGACDEVDLGQRVATAHLQRIPAQEPPIPPTFLVDMNGATPTHSDGEPHTGAAPSLFVFDLQVLLPCLRLVRLCLLLLAVIVVLLLVLVFA